MEREEIEINKGTCAVIPLDEGYCKIIGDEDYKIKSNVINVIEYGCKFFGSSFAGRLEGSKFLLGSHYKLPIILEEQTETIFFPTHSYRHKECSWISLNSVKDYRKSGYQVEVEFNNGKTVFIPVSFDSFEAQVFRSTKLLLILQKRNKKNRE